MVCRQCRNIGLSGVGHKSTTHYRFILSIEGQTALESVDPAVAASQVAGAEAMRRDRTSAIATRQTTVSTPAPRTGERVPSHLRYRHGDRIRHGFDHGWQRDPSAASWRQVNAEPAAFLSRPQLLETVLGKRVRRVSRETLANIRRVIPNIEVRQAWHCFHAVFSPTVIGAFTNVLNTNLATANLPTVDHAEFVTWIATFLLRCIVPARHRGARAFSTGVNTEAGRNLMESGRFQDIKRHFTLLRGHDRSEQVKQTSD